MGTTAAPAGSEPNAENKLFIGGCPPGSGEEDLRKIFEEHGDVEEIFIMRGGSRSGMACAFVRYLTQEMAQKAIDAIHGRVTLPGAAEPLVVRWADAPGSRKRDSREGGRGGKNRGDRASRESRDSGGSVPAVGQPVYSEYTQGGWNGYGQGQMQYGMYPQYGPSGGYYGQHGMADAYPIGYGAGGFPPQMAPQMMHMPYHQQQQMAMAQWGMIMHPSQGGMMMDPSAQMGGPRSPGMHPQPGGAYPPEMQQHAPMMAAPQAMQSSPEHVASH